MNTTPIAMLAAGLALTACATPTPAPQPGIDLNVGISKTCEASPVDLSASSSASATIRMSNDGWCAVRTAERDGQPFLVALVRNRADHGQVYIQKIGGQNRVEYTANPGYSGTDTFSVALRSRTPNTPDATVQVAVTVLPGAGVPVAAPAAPPSTATPAATAPRSPATTPSRSTPARSPRR